MNNVYEYSMEFYSIQLKLCIQPDRASPVHALLSSTSSCIIYYRVRTGDLHNIINCNLVQSSNMIEPPIYHSIMLRDTIISDASFWSREYFVASYQTKDQTHYNSIPKQWLVRWYKEELISKKLHISSIDKKKAYLSCRVSVMCGRCVVWSVRIFEQSRS